jgi:HPt (histidine-containing phosphotransfer) domain-containing protein
MDGIETTAAIRKWEKEQQENGVTCNETPIIALTANAVMGMREMFIENGFNDFLSKPIDISKLDEMLDKWIPKEKREKGSGESGVGSRERSPYDDSISRLYPNNSNHDSPPPAIPGIDTAKGIALTGGTVAAYRQVLSLFCKDAQDRMALLQKEPAVNALSTFITQVHALKSASASIGAQEVSVQAAELENAGKTADMAFISEHLPVFAQQLAELVKNIQNILGPDKPDGGSAAPSLPAPYFPLLKELAEALKSQNASEIDRILEELNQKPLDAGIREMLQRISDEVLMTEFDSAVKTVDSLARVSSNGIEI